MAKKQWPRPKDPDEIVDYEIDWTPQLSDDNGVRIEGLVIASSSWPTVPVGITKDSDSKSDTGAKIRVSGGTTGETYELVNRVVLSDGQIWDQTCILKMKTR